MKYRLGLDVGTNSLGWSVLEVNRDGKPCRIESAGVRIFSDGRDQKSKSTLQATRREARSARRRRDRYLQRKQYLLSELKQAELFPHEPRECKSLQALNPIELRANAVHEQLPLHHIGRALFHLNQRRGFKSNRRDRSEEATSGVVSNSVRNLLEKMELLPPAMPKEEFESLSKEDKSNARKQDAEKRRNAIKSLNEQSGLTFGVFLWNRQQVGEPIRARRDSDSKLYDVYPSRELLEDEFNKIWRFQSQFYPETLTSELRDKLFNVIFFQRPLKPQPIGKCTYLEDEVRTYKAMPSFQRYRIFQEVNSLEWDEYGQVQKLRELPYARDEIVYLLEHPSAKKTPTTRNARVSFRQMKNRLIKLDIADGEFRFNFETEKRDFFDGNSTANIMQHEECIGKPWHDWPIERQDEFIALILNADLSDEEVEMRLIKDYGLDHFRAQNCMNAPLLDGTANISLRAARLLTKKMEEECVLQTEAVEQVSAEVENFVNPYQQAREGKLLEKLPYYGKAVRGHVIPGHGDEEREEDRIGRVSNPTVHIAMNQIRLVVNELIDQYGHPGSIAIELGRDLPVGKDGRSKIEKEQKDNQKKNEDWNDKLTELNQTINRTNRLKLELWERQNKRCVFSGNSISCAELFSNHVEIEHLIPFSKSLDDSRANKVICITKANRDKGNRTPFEAFGHSPDGYDWETIAANVRDLPTSKQWRFQKNALEIWNKESEDFSSRHLNDTRYIGRLAKEYLQCVCSPNNIDVVSGRLTALLRSHWGLNGVFDGGESGTQNRKKNRDDHRHHSIDAIVIGMTTRSILQTVSRAANRAEELHLPSLFERSQNGTSPIDPWNGFRNDVLRVIENIVVSHKKRSKKVKNGATDGQLHLETAYGVVPNSEDDRGVPSVVSRWPIEKFEKEPHLKLIRDPYLRKEFLAAYKTNGKDGIRERAQQDGIRSLRSEEKKSVISIKDKNDKIYKGYSGNSNWGVEIYEYPSGHPKYGNYKAAVIQTFEANQSNFKPGITKRPHPAAKLVMRLQVNDCVEFSQNNGQCSILRLQKITQSGQLTFALHNEANVDKRDRDKKDSFNYFRIQAHLLKPEVSKKVHVSAIGRVSYDSRI